MGKCVERWDCLDGGWVSRGREYPGKGKNIGGGG